MKNSRTETVPDGDIVEVLGIAKDNSVRAKTNGRDVMQALRKGTGGELT